MRHFIFSVLWVLVLVSSLAHAKKKEKEPLSPITICALMVGQSSHHRQGLDLTGIDINPDRSSVIKELFKKPAQDGVRNFILQPGGYSAAVHFLNQLGLVGFTPTDPYYVPMLLLAQNLGFNINETEADPIISAYLKKAYSKQVKFGNVPNTIIPAADEQRYGMFLEYFGEALSQLKAGRTAVQRKNGIDAIEVFFTEFQRLYERYEMKKEISFEQFQEGRGKLLRAIDCEEGKLPSIMAAPRPGIMRWVGEINLMAPTIETIVDVIRYLRGEGNRELYRRFGHPFKTPAGYVSEPNTLYPYIGVVDFYGYELLARNFLTRYLSALHPMEYRVPELYSVEFADDLRTAFWENTLIRQDGMQNRYGDKGRDLSGLFGDASYESYKSMGRSALAIALINGDDSYFNVGAPGGMSKAEFRSLSADMLKDLGLTGLLGNLDRDAVDTFFVFLQLDALGRGRDGFIDQLDEIHHISQKVGTDYERRTLEILKHYPLAAYSFIRLPAAAREKIIRCFKLIYHYNAGQGVQSESSRNAYKAFEGASVEDAAFVFYRAILSYGALPQDAKKRGTFKLDGFMLRRYLMQRDLLFSVCQGTKSGAAYFANLQWMAQVLNQPLPDSIDTPDPEGKKQITLLRLAIQAGYLTPETAGRIGPAFDSLSDEEQAVLTRVMTDYYALSYFSADVFRALVDRAGEGADPADAEKIWMKVLVRGYRHLEKDQRFHFYNADMKDRGEVRVGFGSFKDFILNDRGNLDRVLHVPFVSELQDGAFAFQF